MAIAATITSDQELLAATVLHDTVEDTDVTLEDLRKTFGNRIADIVDAESDISIEGISEEDSWRMRKQTAMDRLAKSSREVKIVALGDKLSNMRAIYRDFLAKGDSIWSLFHVKEKSEHEWHYRGLAESLGELSGTEAYREFTDLIEIVFRKQH